MINHLSKFTTCLADKIKPFRDLLVKDCHWVWDEVQQMAFETLQCMLTSSPVLTLFNPRSPTVVSADTSSYGLGTMLLQRQSQENQQPVAYIHLDQ